MIPPLRKSRPLHPPRRHRHELIQDQKLELQLENIAERLNRMANARLIEVDQDDRQDVQTDGDDIDVNQVGHDAALSDARFGLEDPGQGVDVDAAEDALDNRVPELGAPVQYGFSGRVKGGQARVVRVVCLPDEDPGRDDHQARHNDDHDEHPSLDPVIPINEVQSGIEDKKLRGRVDGPAEEDEEGVEWPEGLGVRDEELDDDGDGVDEAAPGSEQHAPVVEALFSVEFAVDAQVDVEEEVEDYGDEAAGG